MHEERDEQFDYDDGGYGCPHCEDGAILVCIDDMCRGSGECFHGDGYATCPYCKGTGEIQPSPR
jgi:hypothetical protein